MPQTRRTPLVALAALSFVALKGDGCGGPGAGVASCSTDKVRVSLHPNECAPVPSCASGGYFDAAQFAVEPAVALPDWLSIEFHSITFGSPPVAQICASPTASPGDKATSKLNGSKQGVVAATTNLDVDVLGRSSMEVQLHVPNARVANGRTLIAANQVTNVNAYAVSGSFAGATGMWSLLSQTATFSMTSSSAGEGQVLAPNLSGPADLVLRLSRMDMGVVVDDAFSIPVRIMRQGDAAADVSQLNSVYHGTACPGATQALDCPGVILCFSSAGTVLSWPDSAMTTNSLHFESSPAATAESASANGYSICRDGVNTVSAVIRDQSGNELDRATIVVHQ